MIPLSPISITVSGNKCGGCCRTAPVRGEIPSHYIIILTGSSQLTAIPHKALEKNKESEIAAHVFNEIKNYFRDAYALEWEDLPVTIRPRDLTKAPSVEELRKLEAATAGFVEGVKKGKSSSGSLCTPILRSTPTPEDYDAASESVS